MTETNDAPLTVTLKAGGGFDAPWLVLRGNHPEEVTSMLRNLGDLPAAVIEASALLQAANNLTPIVSPAPGQTHEQAYRADAQAAPQQQAWGAAPPQQQAPQQQYQQQGGGGGRFAGTPHPEGKQCAQCGQVIVEKTTGGGKKAWRCPDWRWNNGNPNGHTSEWAN